MAENSKDKSLLSAEEISALDQTVELFATIGRIVGDGVTRADDMREFATLMHNIQSKILAQAAARAHPYDYRLLGEVVISLTESERD